MTTSTFLMTIPNKIQTYQMNQKLLINESSLLEIGTTNNEMKKIKRVSRKRTPKKNQGNLATKDQEELLEKKKQMRREMNRISSRRSREKKKIYFENLEKEVVELRKEREILREKVQYLTSQNEKQQSFDVLMKFMQQVLCLPGLVNNPLFKGQSNNNDFVLTNNPLQNNNCFPNLYSTNNRTNSNNTNKLSNNTNLVNKNSLTNNKLENQYCVQQQQQQQQNHFR
eukprot:Anaeramoba_flamelloidesa85804_29.p1 GENE.a85804_29~~a85804_29.p1  ORF type:complete len:226 (-),score=53.69 a85804_29:239-916(-)